MLIKLLKIFGAMVIGLFAMILAFFLYMDLIYYSEDVRKENQIKIEENRAKLAKISPPPRLPNKETEVLMRFDNTYFYLPRDYYLSEYFIGFHWVNHTPVLSKNFIKKSKNYYENTIEITVWPGTPESRASVKKQVNRPYLELLDLEKQGKVLKKEILRKGLERWTVAHPRLPNVYDLRYLATNLKDANGDIPVLRCEQPNSDRFPACMTGVIWKYFEKTGGALRIIEKNAIDFPEIYAEAYRIMNLIKDR